MNGSVLQSGGSQSFDVAVVGGGPAGAICAFMLARGGACVSLVHWDGYSIGGIELVSGRARRTIEQYCPDFFRRVAPGLEVHETISLWGTPEPVTLSAMFNPWGAGVALERELLDRALRSLASAAGVSVVAGTKVMDIERRGDRWHLSLRSENAESDPLCARFVVLATGRAAARFFDQVPMAESSQIALMTSLSPQPGIRDYALYVEAVDNGWWYALPIMDGGYFAGFCTSREAVKRRHASLRYFFFEELYRTRLLAPLISSAQGKTCNLRDTRNPRITGRMAGTRSFSKATGDGWIAIGDAAYAPDPLSGMGIEVAIESAQLGARALLGAIQGETQHEAFAEYEDSVRTRTRRHDKTAAYHYGGF
ncbi:MAG: NAD(P)/FAD-dependent oxidoreductase [Pseudomonadota bacterium]|nr:NAD(P)/FAD-dependent oxidoreductase [Pseudomonadota bacterium]